jgi:DNA repair ATPase RecN
MMADAPKPFWYFAGSGVLLVLIAIAYRVALGSGGSVDLAGLKVEIDSAQQGLTAAQSTVDDVAQQAEAQAKEITLLESRLAQAQTRIRQLVAEIQRMPQASAAVKQAAQLALREDAAQAPPPVTRIDTMLLSKAQTQLKNARISVAAVRTKIAPR